MAKLLIAFLIWLFATDNYQAWIVLAKAKAKQ